MIFFSFHLLLLVSIFYLLWFFFFIVTSFWHCRMCLESKGGSYNRCWTFFCFKVGHADLVAYNALWFLEFNLIWCGVFLLIEMMDRWIKQVFAVYNSIYQIKDRLLLLTDKRRKSQKINIPVLPSKSLFRYSLMMLIPHHTWAASLWLWKRMGWCY